MGSKQIYEIFKDLDICAICTLRYLNARCNEFDDVQQAYKNVSVFIIF